MKIFTIGFTKKSAKEFFTKLKEADVKRLVDVRLNNTSQLAGFAKRDDLRYFLEELLGAEYVHEPMLAPTPKLLKTYRKGDMIWQDYEDAFLDLMAQRRIENQVEPDLLGGRTVLLCSESSHAFCHRRLIVEYLNETWGNVKAVHL